MTFQDYSPGSPATSAGSGGGVSGRKGQGSKPEYWTLSKLKQAFRDYLASKTDEINEQKDARRYYHGAQWTAEQIAVLKKRKQPVMTFNRVGRKIDGVVGLIEKLRQDPKAFARTPQHEEGAELATAALRYVLDEQEWKAKSPQVAQDGAVDGLGGIELDIIQGDKDDPEIGFDEVDVQAFFYDPRSYKYDFSDARYMGVGKWLDEDIARDMFPDEDIDSAFSSDLTSNSDREARWFQTEGPTKRVRIVECWYQHKGKWCWAVFTGSSVLKEGESPFIDEKGKTYCKYIMFSGNVDQDGDRYGFVRNMKSAQDGINAKQSKMQHSLASRRIFLSQGAVQDVEKARAEWAREDGVIVTNGPVGEGAKADDRSFDFAGWSKMLELNLSEIENYGPNPALIGGQNVEKSSGRAIALLQQAGMAELGPYILAYRGWKIRVYRAIWNAVQKHWQAERWIRVTDDEGIAQFIQINGLQTDPQTGQPTLVNAIGSLDVDIILDEAPDAVTMQGQSFEVLQALGPQFIQQYPDVALELAPLDGATKKKIRDKQEKAAQAQQPQQQLAMASEQAKVEQTNADAQLKQAQTAKTMVEAHLAPVKAMQDAQSGPTAEPVDPQMQAAEIEDKLAGAFQKRAQGELALVNAHLRPAETIEEALQGRQEIAMTQENAQADRAQADRHANADRQFQAVNSERDRESAAQQAKMKAAKPSAK